MGRNTKIEWCDASVNPVTGCWHGCEYCYARSIANRFAGADCEPDGSSCVHRLDQPLFKTFKSGKKGIAPYPYGFNPTFHTYKLDEINRYHGKTIFVCSMADLFGDWVPDKWIQMVFDACKENPSNRYLFLTKNPKRMLALGKENLLPTKSNFWYGSTITDPDMPAFWSDEHNTFVSMEPILASFDCEIGSNSIIDTAKWIILGAETGNRKAKIHPKRIWIESAVQKMQERGVPVFMKDSMKPIWGEDILTQFPW